MAREVVETCRSRGKSVDATWAPWWRAAHKAIHHVAMLQEPNKERGDRYLRKELDFADMLELKGRKAMEDGNG